MVRRAQAGLVRLGRKLAGPRRLPVGDQQGASGRQDLGCRERAPRRPDVHHPRTELVHDREVDLKRRRSTSTSKSTAKSTAPAKTASATVPSKATPPAKTESTAQQVTLIRNALIAHQVVAVLFYNPAASDDQAVDHELAAVPTHGGQVVKLAVPLSELTSFAVITQQIPVVTAPTLVLVDSSRQATTITGFVDPLEISQRVDDALAAK